MRLTCRTLEFANFHVAVARVAAASEFGEMFDECCYYGDSDDLSD
jgi:hypothetical protein